MAQLLGMGLLLNANHAVATPSEAARDQVEAEAIAAMTQRVQAVL